MGPGWLPGAGGEAAFFNSMNQFQITVTAGLSLVIISSVLFQYHLLWVGVMVFLTGIFVVVAAKEISEP